MFNAAKFKDKLGYLAVILLVLGMALAAMAVERLNNTLHAEAVRIATQDRLANLRSRLEGGLHGDIQLVRGLVSVVANNPKLTQAEFSRAAKPLFDGATNLRNIGAAPDMVMRLIYPVAGNEKAIGLDYRKSPGQFEMADRVRRTGQMALAGPLQLAQGGGGIIARMPVVAENKSGEQYFWGLISAVIDVDSLYRNSGLLDQNLQLEIAIRGKDGAGAGGEVFFGSPQLFEANPVLADIPLPNGSWQLAAVPRGGWPTQADNVWTVRLGIALIGLLMIVPFIVLSRALLALGRARKQAESERLRLSAVLDSTPSVAIQWYDRAGRVIYWNRASELLFGWTKQEALGKTLGQLIFTPEQARNFADILVQLNDTDTVPPPFDSEVKHRDGSLRFIQSVVFSIPGEIESIFVCMDVDITDRKQAEEALYQSRAQYQYLLDKIGDSFVVYSHKVPSGELIYVSEGVSAVFGIAKQDVLNKTWMEAINWLPESIERAASYQQRLLSGELNVAGFEMHFIHPAGEMRTVGITTHSVRDDAGNVIRLDGIAEDISERKATESVLRESEQRFRQMFEKHSAVMLLVDPNLGAIVDANPAAAKFYGYPLESLRGMEIAHINALGSEEIDQAMRHAAEENRNYFVFEHRLADASTRFVEVHSSPIILTQQKLLFSIIHDISERKQIEADLRIAATAFESGEGVLITDARSKILRVNRAFTEITGYPADEVIGKNPSILSSGLQGADFYALMWERLSTTGSWAGEILNRRRNGEIYPEHLTITAVKNEDGVVTNYVAALADITQRKAAEEKIRDLAFYDPLTRLPNRRLLLDRLQHALSSSARSVNYGALLFIDLDNFKGLNDTLGHDIGDLLLQQVARRLKTCVREGDTVARLGGDEFVLVLEDLSGEASEAASLTEAVCKKIQITLNLPFELGHHEHHSTPSIGVTLFVGHQTEIEELLKQADIAMYQAKKAGRNTLRFFDPVMQSMVTSHIEMEADLRRAVIEQEQFQLFYQPQVDASGILIGVEALLRWQHPQRGMVSPAEFIPLAEESGLILPLGHWVLATACRQLAEWAKKPKTADLTMAVNVSVRQFSLPTIVEEVIALIDYFGIDPSKLKLEITEGMLFENVGEIIEKMTALKARGIQFSLDDFGTGYSSLQYLKRLPLDQLKIDQSFVRDIVSDSNDRAIVKTVMAMARSMDLDVIAEGVETEEQRQMLLKKGCRHFQGYLFGRPVPIEELEATMSRSARIGDH